eukprot:TRINITY_DN4062_c0_g1_i3.p1 TRINITY_DN4062_c0_g1~~TRINITY_DN4062_c0_g1_i3.p1  ORF type:complete len:187 (-),score=74.20 TRINITY_DN4062_c0_g1_i3:73-633(-)
MAEKEYDEEIGDENYDPEAETKIGGDWKTVNLPEVPVVTGEEDDEVLEKFRVKLYRWVGKEWKERGVGDLKFLKSKHVGRVRLLMRQEKTHKVIANHYIEGEGLCQLTPMKTNDKSLIWVAYDSSDEKPSVEKVCARFLNKEDMAKFQERFERTYKENETSKAAEGTKAQPAEEAKQEEVAEPKKE